MKQFGNILLAVKDPGEQQALIRRGLKLASDLKAALTVIVVLDEPPWLIEAMMKREHQIDVRQRMVEEAESQIRRVHSDSGIENVDLGAEALFGSPFMTIIQQVLRCRHDLLLTGGASHPRSRFGNTVLRLLRKCPCPVWVVDANKETSPVNKVLAAINDRHGDDAVEEINHRVLDLALGVARDEQAELHVLQVWRHFGEEFQRGHWGLAESDVDAIDLQLQQESEDALEQCLANHHFSGPQPHLHLLKGDAASLIPEFVSKEGIDLTVMGTICRTGVPGFLIGNTAEKVLRQINCSVMAVKPAGFHSPVALDEAIATAPRR